MAPLLSRTVVRALSVVMLLAIVAAACTGGDDPGDAEVPEEAMQLDDAPRRYAAEWLIDTRAIDREDLASPLIYREVVDDLNGRYLVETPGHLAMQEPDEVIFCAAVSRIPFDPFCAAAPRAEGSPNVLSYPVQTLRRDWGPRPLYDLASYAEVSFAAASDPDSWSIQDTNSTSGVAIECFLVTGETTAAAPGFEICFTDDDLRLVASVDLQNDLVFEIELISYDRVRISEEFETDLEPFIEQQASLQEQLLDLYPELPAPRPTPTPTPVETGDDG